jgi:hypothetical protein
VPHPSHERLDPDTSKSHNTRIDGRMAAAPALHIDAQSGQANPRALREGCVMNELERLLTDDVARLIDRLATSLPADTISQVRTSLPRLSSRIEEADQRLAEARNAVLEEYARWCEALEDVENLWALAAWKTAVVDEPAGGAIRTAA